MEIFSAVKKEAFFLDNFSLFCVVVFKVWFDFVESEHWFDIGKDNTYACNDCRPFLGTINKTTLPDEITEPPYMFRPVKEEAEWKHSTPVSLNVSESYLNISCIDSKVVNL